MPIKKIAAASAAIWIVGTVFGFLTCGWLFNWVYTIPPLIWKAPEAMISGGNFAGSIILGLLRAVIFVYIFTLVAKALPCRGIKLGACYGLIIWSVGALSGMITMPFFMTISWAVIIYWILQALVLDVVNGIITAVILKKQA